MNILDRSFCLTDFWRLRHLLLLFIKRVLKLTVFLNVCRWFMFGFMRLVRLPYMPLYAMVEITSRCNIACEMCERSLFTFNREEKDMSLCEFKKIIDQLSQYLIFVVLWNYGEPLLHEDLEEMIAYCSKKGIISIVSTNGLLLERQRSIKLISAGLKYLIISVDGANKQVYSKYRKGSDFEKVAGNTKAACLLKRQMKSLFPIVELQCIVMEHNEFQVEHFLHMAQLWGADRVSLKKFSTLLRYGHPANFLPENNQFILEAFRSDKGVQKRFCVTPWRSLVINSDGNIVPCCCDYFSIRKMGDAFNDKVRDIWNSRKYVEFRRAIKENINVVEICSDCSHIDAQEGGFTRTNFRVTSGRNRVKN